MHITETKKLHKITSDERTEGRLNMATLTDDGEKVYRITNDGFAENAVCHATCMTNYLLKRIKVT
jgi:Tfp pilus assembly protein PilX